MMNPIKRITGLACLAAAVICSGCWFSSDDADSSKAQPAPMDLKAEIKNASDLIDWIKIRKDQTEIQKKDAFSKLKGKMVVFRGEVREVGKTAFGGKPFVSLKVGKLDMFENINIQFNFKDSQASTVAAWGKGETHILRGRIKGSGDLQDDASCDNSEIVPDEKFIEVAGEKVNDLKTKVRETLGENTTDKIESSLDDLKNKLKDL